MSESNKENNEAMLNYYNHLELEVLVKICFEHFDETYEINDGKITKVIR